MKITCQKNDLLLGLNIAMRAVPSKTTLPILESFLIIADSEIRIITNDKDMGIATGIEGNVIEPGKIAIDARFFGDIVRKMPDNEVVIEADNALNITVSCEESVFNLKGRDPEEFPELPETVNEKKITLSQFTLKEIIRQTIFSVAINDTNNMMRGELFEVKGDVLKVVSLDSFRISIRREKLGQEYENIKVIVPGKTLNEILEFLK